MTSLAQNFTADYPVDMPTAPRPGSVSRLRRCSAWLVEEHRWRWARVLGGATLKAFTTHPAETRETYFQHLWFTIRTSLRFLAIAVLLFLHGVFPFLCTRTASRQIERIYLMMRSRIPEARREVLKAEYDI